MAIALANLGEPESKAAAKKSTRTAIEAVARLLRNTVAVCKKCYVHPAVIDRYLDGSLMRIMRSKPAHKRYFKAEEAVVAELLKSTL